MSSRRFRADPGLGGRTLLERRPGGPGYWIAVLALTLLSVAGAAMLFELATSGDQQLSRWAYPAATLVFLLSSLMSAPVLAFTTRVGRGFWGAALRRPAELFGVAGLIVTPSFALLLQLPSGAERPSIWFGWPGAPVVWDSLAIILLSLLGLALLYLNSLPDRAGRRRRHGRGRDGSPRWRGGRRQWQALSKGLVLLGALYTIFFCFTQLLVASDLTLTLVPHWSNAILPAYLAISGFQAGLAASLVVLALVRRESQDEMLLDPAPFHLGGKLLLAFALLWFYFWWSEFLTYWYGRTPTEIWLLGLLMFGPYFGLFALSFGLNFLLPLVLLVWNPIRNSVVGPASVAVLVLIGNFVDRVRLYAASWSAADLPPTGEVLAQIPGRPLEAEQVPALPVALVPDLVSAMAAVGLLSGVGLLYLLALRAVPAVAVWELRAVDRLTIERPYLETSVEIVARPN
jgi:hypothetical protein